MTKRYGPITAVDDLSVEALPGSFTALLGPSGCGKSTTLGVIGGLIEPDSGQVYFDDVSVRDVPAERRPAATVFQKPLLFPHLSVEQNVAFGLRMRHTGRAEMRRRVADILERVQLPELGRRRVGELSGGQEQRVALARALVLQPQVLLLDEPFSQLDASLRAEMRALVRELHDESKVTTLFVTHDQAEAVEVADTIILMLAGRLAGQGPPESFYTRPPSLAAARFFGVTNEIPGVITDATFHADDDQLRVAAPLPDGRAVLVVRPEVLRISTSGGPDTVAGVARSARFAGTHSSVEVVLAKGTVLVAHQPIGHPIRLGATIHLQVPAEACTVFAADQT